MTHRLATRIGLRVALIAAMLSPLTLIGAHPAHAAEESATFNVSFGGIRAGTLAFRAKETGGRYTTNGSARASGVLGALFDDELDTVAQGQVQANTYRPTMAREVTVGSGETTERSYRYDGAGVPNVTRIPARGTSRHAAPASAQGGTVDTTTAAYAILRDRHPDLACQLDISVYDGRKRHRIELNRPEPTANGLLCTGRYTRVAGFSPKDMAERTEWPLRMEYQRLADGTMRVQQLSLPTSFGQARVTRR